MEGGKGGKGGSKDGKGGAPPGTHTMSHIHALKLSHFYQLPFLSARLPPLGRGGPWWQPAKGKGKSAAAKGKGKGNADSAAGKGHRVKRPTCMFL